MHLLHQAHIHGQPLQGLLQFALCASEVAEGGRAQLATLTAQAAVVLFGKIISLLLQDLHTKLLLVPEETRLYLITLQTQEAKAEIVPHLVV